MKYYSTPVRVALNSDYWSRAITGTPVRTLYGSKSKYFALDYSCRHYKQVIGTFVLVLHNTLRSLLRVVAVGRTDLKFESAGTTTGYWSTTLFYAQKQLNEKASRLVQGIYRNL